MKQNLAIVTIVVKDYDEALNFFIQKLGFELIEDTFLSDDKRWILISPPRSKSCQMLLAKASNNNQLASVGNQTGGRVAFFLHTDDFQRDFERFIKNGVRFVRPPEAQPYGIVAVFEDLYGNLWDLIQPNGMLEQQKIVALPG